MVVIPFMYREIIRLTNEVRRLTEMERRCQADLLAIRTEQTRARQASESWHQGHDEALEAILARIGKRPPEPSKQ